MKTLIVYDSAYGNTEKIAEAIGIAIGPQQDVAVVSVTDVKKEQLTGLELLVVGSPTQGFRPTKAISNFIANLPGLPDVNVAAFDTRIDIVDIKSAVLKGMVRLGGYAAKHIEGALKKKGGKPIMPSEGFFVKDREGPLKDGEIERAANWAKQINEMRRVKKP